MTPKDITLYSGGARGAEETFGKTAQAYGLSQINFTFVGHHIAHEVDTVNLTPSELSHADVIMTEVSKRMGRDYSKSPWMRQILQSIWYQVNRGYQVFVVGIIQEDNTVKGGTGWAAELGKLMHRPLFVFDTEREGWFTWADGGWAEANPVINSDTICGTGTRSLPECGKKAIEDLFERSFKK